MNIALVTDSASDIPDFLLQEKHIFMVPNIVTIEGESFLDGIDITREDFYRRLPELHTQPTTATASPGIYQTLYSDLLSQGFEKVISIHTASLLSGIYNAACNAAQAFGEKVCVIDSQQLSLGLGFQVLAAAESIAEGSRLEAVLHKIEEVRKRIRLIAMLDTLEYVHRSGRVSWAKARISNFLRIKPFLEVKEGKVLSLGEVRTRRKGIQRLTDIISKLGHLEKIAILHSNKEDDARNLQQNISALSDDAPLLINVTTVIGVHVGPNGLGFAAITS